MSMDYFNQTIKTFSILFGVLVVGVLLGIFLVDIGYVPGNPDGTVGAAAISNQEREEIRIDVTLDYGNGDVQSFSKEIMRETDTVLDLLSMLERKYGITTERRNFPGLGIFIEAIHGVHNSNNFYWQYWVNSEYAKVAAGQYMLQDGDKVLWKRTGQIEE